MTNGLQLVGPYSVAEDDVMLHVAPMFHSADLLGTPFSLSGTAHAYLPEFTPDAFMNAVQKSRATFTMLFPTLLIRIVREGKIGDFEISSLRRLTYGSAPTDTVWIRRAMEALPGVDLVHGYGLTETSPILTTLGWNHQLDGNRLRSVGRPTRREGLERMGRDRIDFSLKPLRFPLSSGTKTSCLKGNQTRRSDLVDRSSWLSRGDGRSPSRQQRGCLPVA